MRFNQIQFYKRYVFIITTVLLIYSVSITILLFQKKHCNVHTTLETTTVEPTTTTELTTISTTKRTTRVTTAPPPKLCSNGYSFINDTGFCYKTALKAVDFADANSSCQAENAHLASIHSVKENSLVMALYYRTLASYLIEVDYTMQPNFVWIGLTADPNTKKWTWTDGTPTDFFFWDSGEPNNMNSEYWVWIVDFKNNKFYNDERTWNNIDNQKNYGAFACKKPVEKAI